MATIKRDIGRVVLFLVAISLSWVAAGDCSALFAKLKVLQAGSRESVVAAASVEPQALNLRLNSWLQDNGAKTPGEVATDLKDLYSLVADSAAPLVIKAQEQAGRGIVAGAKTAGRASMAALTTSVHLLAPVPLPNSFLPSQRSIFLKQWLDPKYVLSVQEANLLRGTVVEINGTPKNALSLFFARQIELQRYRTPGDRLSVFSVKLLRLAQVGSVVLAGNHLLQNQLGGVISKDEYLESEKYRLKDDEVQIITDMMPMPHLSLRIGDKVYWYGVSQMKSKPAYEYFDRDTNEIGPHSAQIVTLKIGKDARDRVRRELELSTGKVYTNETAVNDCATMALRKLEEFGGLGDSALRCFDASPSQVSMYFSALKTSGDARVMDVFTVATQQPENKQYHLLRNYWINFAESKYFALMAPQNQLARLKLDIESKNKPLEHFDPKTLAEFDSWRKEVQNEINGDFFLVGLERKLKNVQSAEQKKPVIDALRFELQKKADHHNSILNNPDAEVLDIVRAQAALIVINEHKKELGIP